MDHKTILIAIAILVQLLNIYNAQDPPCPLYPMCSRHLANDGPCTGSDGNNTCPGGRTACSTDGRTSAVISCCCIKYDPFYKHLVAGDAKPPLNPKRVRTYSMRFCPYAQRVMLTSVVKNVSTDIVFINLNKPPEWFEIGLGGQVPIIETAYGSIGESLILSDYLDEEYCPSSMYPTQAFQKAKDRQLIANFSKLIPGLFYDILYGKGYANVSEVPVLMKQFESFISQLGTELEKRGTTYFLGNDGPGMLDYMIWPWMERRVIFQLFYPDAHNYTENSARMDLWVDEMKQNEAVQTFLLSPEVHFEYAVSSRAGRPNYDMLAGI